MEKLKSQKVKSQIGKIKKSTKVVKVKKLEK
jgi:hypothetical protein